MAGINIRDSYKQWLIEQGLKTKTPSKHSSTVTEYLRRIDRICDKHYKSHDATAWNKLTKNIQALLISYHECQNKEYLINKQNIDAFLKYFNDISNSNQINLNLKVKLSFISQKESQFITITTFKGLISFVLVFKGILDIAMNINKLSEINDVTFFYKLTFDNVSPPERQISLYQNAKDVNIWRTLEHQRKLKYLHDACNDFFHNVTTNDEEFINMIKSLLSSTSEKYNKDSYVNKINLFSACNAVITKKLEETKAQLITTQKESKMGGVETNSLKNKEKTTYKENEWTRTSAEMYCNANGYEVSKHFNYASPNKVAKGEYWINAALDFVSNDWDIILNDKNNHCFHILHIPANTFSVDDFNIKTGKKSGSKLDIHIDIGSLNDRNDINFKPYLVKTIEY